MIQISHQLDKDLFCIKLIRQKYLYNLNLHILGMGCHKLDVYGLILHHRILNKLTTSPNPKTRHSQDNIDLYIYVVLDNSQNSFYRHKLGMVYHKSLIFVLIPIHMSHCSLSIVTSLQIHHALK